MKAFRISFILFMASLFACQTQTTEEEGQLPKIVCTTGMIADAVNNLVQDKATVISLMGAGVDPHLYKATQGDLRHLSSADIIIYNGLHLEGKMGEILEKLAARKTIIALGETLPESLLINNTAFQGTHDPHIWFDVTLWQKACTELSSLLQEEIPEQKKTIADNQQQFSQQLTDLDLWVKQEISSIPDSQRVLITAHDAFGYFGRAYGIDVRGLQGISTLSEYGLKDVTELVDFISKRKIKAVFVESSVSDRSLKAVAEGCESKGHPISIGGTLYSDAMGQAGTVEGTYLGMVRYNVNTIVNALK